MVGLLESALPALRFATSNVVSLMVRKLMNDPACLDALARAMQRAEAEVSTGRAGQTVISAWRTLDAREKALWIARAHRALAGLHAFMFTKPPQPGAPRAVGAPRAGGRR